MSEHIEPVASVEEKLTRDELKEAICKQVEYYFSRQNLSTDHYLVSQMNHDLFVPISVIANFKMVKTLTNDYDLICEAVKNSNQVIIDEVNKKLKPNIVLKRNTVIIRDIPQSTPQEEILNLFSPDNQPDNIHSDIGDTWFTSFETEDKAIDAVQHLRTQKWNDKPIQARIKTESLLKSVGATPTPSTQQNGSSYQPNYSYYNNNRGNRKYNNNTRTTGQQNGSTGVVVQQPRTQGNSYNRPQSGNNSQPSNNTRTFNPTNTTTNATSSSRGGSANRGGRSRSNSGSTMTRGNINGKPTRQRKDLLNLSSTKSFPPLPKNDSSEQVGYGSQKFLRYSKQTVLGVYMQQQENGEHNTKPEILNGKECIAILSEPKKDLELHKPQMDKSQLSKHTIPPENESKDATTEVAPSSLKPTNLLIPQRSSFAEAAITAKDIKTPETPTSSHFFAKTRKRRGSNTPGYNNNPGVTHPKPHYNKPHVKPVQDATTVETKVESSPAISVTTPVSVTNASSSNEQPSWVSIVASKK